MLLNTLTYVRKLLVYIFWQKVLPYLTPLPPVGHIWDVMLVWRKGNINKNCPLCYSIVYYYNGAQRYEQFLQVGWLYRVLIVLGLALCLPSASVSSVLMVLYRYYFFCLHPSLYLLLSWAWWDWPLTWLTNHRPSVLWHCWLGHVTRKTVSEMTYNVSSGTLNSTIPYLPYLNNCTNQHARFVSDSWASCCHVALVDKLFCFLIINFAEIGQSVDKLWPKKRFSRWRPPPSSISQISVFCHVTVIGFNIWCNQGWSKSDDFSLSYGDLTIFKMAAVRHLGF